MLGEVIEPGRTARDPPRASDDLSRRSYRKTFVLALAGTSLSLAVTLLIPHLNIGSIGSLICAVAGVTAVPSFLVTLASYVVLLRDQRERSGMPDLFAVAFMRRPPDRSRGWRRWIRPLLGPSPRPGDVVVVRSAEEIRHTLVEGRIDGLPFMPEMLAMCGRAFAVDRRVDKINNWRGGNELRRVVRVVTLLGQRCDGAHHDGCDSGCQLLWHERWLRRPDRAERHFVPAEAEGSKVADPTNLQFASELATRAITRTEFAGDVESRYMCQSTELPKASRPMRQWDIRQDLRPLLNGNLGLAGWLVALLTRLFNLAQSARGGVTYPVTPPMLTSPPTPTANLGLVPGERVRVRNKYDIGLTLHRFYNRGMWFGRETLRHCNREYAVIGRVVRVIDEQSGQMRTMKTPAILLDGATATGEFLRLVPQNEYVFWREVWLDRLEPPTQTPHGLGAS